MPLTEEQIDGMAAVFPTEELQLIHAVVTRILEERRRLESIILDERPPGEPRHYEIQNYVHQHIALNPGTTVDRIRATSNLDRDEVEAAIETLVDERIIHLYGGGYHLGVDEVQGESPAAIVIRLAREGQVETFIMDHLLANHVIPTPALRTLTRWAVRYAETGGTDWPEPEQSLREAGVTNAFVEAQHRRQRDSESVPETVIRLARSGASQTMILLHVGQDLIPAMRELIRWAVRAHELHLDEWPTPDEAFRMAQIRVDATQALQESTALLNEQLDRATLAEIQLSNGNLTMEGLVQRQPPGTNLSNVVLSVQRLLSDGRLRTDIANFLHVSPLDPVDPLTLDTLYAQILTNQGRTAIELAAILNMDREAMVHPLAHLMSSNRIVVRDERLYTSEPTPNPLDEDIWGRIVAAIGGLSFTALLDTTVLREGVLRGVVDRLIAQGRVVQHDNGILQALVRIHDEVHIPTRWRQEVEAEHADNPSWVGEIARRNEWLSRETAAEETAPTDTSTPMDREAVRQARVEMDRREALAESFILAQFQFGGGRYPEWLVRAAGQAYLQAQAGQDAFPDLDMGAALARLIQRGEVQESTSGQLSLAVPQRQERVPNPEPLSALDQLLGDDD